MIWYQIFVMNMMIRLGETKTSTNRYLISRRRRFYRNLDNFIDIGYNRLRSRSTGDVGKKLYNDASTAMLMLGEGDRPSIEKSTDNEYTFLAIQSVGFEKGAVIVTIQGLKSGKFLAASDRGSKLFLTKDKTHNIRWRLEVDQTSKQDKYQNTKSGRYLAFGRSRSLRPIQRRLSAREKFKSQFHFLQLVSRFPGGKL